MERRMSNGGKDNVSWRTIGSVCGVLTLFLGVHATILMPSVTAQAHREALLAIEQAMTHHEGRPHKDAINRSEYDRLLEDNKELRSQIRELTSGLARLEGKVDKLNGGG